MTGTEGLLDIGVDIDEVMFDFVGSLREWLHFQYGCQYHFMPEPIRWDFAADWGLTKAEFDDACYAGVDAGFIFARGVPLPGTEVALRQLASLGRIHLVTNRRFGPKTRVNTLRWLGRYGLPYDTLTFTKDKTRVPADIYIDDKPENYDLLDQAGYNPFLRDHPWNQHHFGRRVYDWRGFIDEVLALRNRLLAREAA